jgi:hypothetical protein
MDNRVLRYVSDVAVFLYLQHGGVAPMLRRSANRNRGFRVLWGELLLIRNWRELLTRRRTAQQEIDTGKLPDFLSETAGIRQSDCKWRRSQRIGAFRD